MKEKKQTTAEYYQLWADICRIDPVTYSLEVTSTNEYFGEYVNYPRINYWEWFVIPGEIIFKPSYKLVVKPRVKTTLKVNHKPLLFCNRTIVPLRI